MALLTEQFQIVNQFPAKALIGAMMKLKKVGPPTAEIAFAISELHQIAPHVAPFRAAQVCFVVFPPSGHRLGI
jgi:hypothetical protein